MIARTFSVPETFCACFTVFTMPAWAQPESTSRPFPFTLKNGYFFVGCDPLDVTRKECTWDDLGGSLYFDHLEAKGLEVGPLELSEIRGFGRPRTDEYLWAKASSPT